MARKQGKHKSISKTQMAIGFFVCVAAITFLSFISLPLAVGAFAVMSVIALVVGERAQRQHWEQSVQFKLLRFGKKHDALAREVMRQKASIGDLKGDLRSSVAHSLGAQSISYADLKETAVKPKAKPKANPALRHDKERVTRPLRAVKKQIVKPTPKSSDNNFETVLPDDGSGLSDMVVGELLNHALQHQRVDVFLQPIMRLPQRQRQFYEMFARIRAKPGVYIPAKRYKPMADQDNIMEDLDTILLVECLNAMRQTLYTQDAPAFFMNIASGIFKNKNFMDRVLAFLSHHRDIASRLVFELHHADFVGMDVAALQVMSGLGKLGVRFSLDHVQSTDIDVRDLQRFNVRFVKAPAAMFLDAKTSGQEKARIWKFKRMLEGNGIGLILERIEDEEMMRGLLDFDIHYGQGYLFGRPDVQGAYEPKMGARRRA